MQATWDWPTVNDIHLSQEAPPVIAGIAYLWVENATTTLLHRHFLSSN